MVQASEAWRANLRAEYILSQVGGRGRRRCGGEEDSDQRCQARCPAIFISKIFSQKIWPKNWGGSSNRKFREWFVCGSGPAPPRPPFVQMKNTPVGSFPRGGFPGRHSARAIDHWVGRSATGYQFHAWVCHILATFGRPLAGIGLQGAFGGLQNFWRLAAIRHHHVPGRTARCESDAPMWARVWVDADE